MAESLQGHGCTVEARLSEIPELARKWVVEPDYPSLRTAKIAVLCSAAKEGLFEFIEFKGESPPAGHQTWFELACEGKIPRIPKRKEPPEEVEDDYEEGQITEGPKVKKKKIQDKNVIVGHDSVSQTGDIISPDVPVIASPAEQPSETFISASDASTLAMPAAPVVQQPSRCKGKKKKSNANRRRLPPHPDDPHTSLGPSISLIPYTPYAPSPQGYPVPPPSFYFGPPSGSPYPYGPGYGYGPPVMLPMGLPYGPPDHHHHHHVPEQQPQRGGFALPGPRPCDKYEESANNCGLEECYTLAQTRPRS